MENKFGLQIDFDPKDCISFLEDVGILTKTEEGWCENLYSPFLSLVTVRYPIFN